MQKPTFQSLFDSLWTFGALLSLGEAGAFPLLARGATLDEIFSRTKIPESILKAILNVLISAEFINSAKDTFKATGDLAEKFKSEGTSRTLGKMYSNFGQVRELIQASKLHQLKAGWLYTDENILQAQGAFSEIVVMDFIPLFPDIKTLLQKPGAKFLDVGAGVGKIALKACELYPNITAVALEPAEVPYFLAEKNLAASSFGNRLKLLKMGVQDLNEDETFDVIWVAQAFIFDEHFIPSLKKLKKALKPGGILLTVEFHEKPLEEKTLEFYTMDLMSALYGVIRTPTEVINLLRMNDFRNIKSLPYKEYVDVIIAQVF